jgi:hypothetical protein
MGQIKSHTWKTGQSKIPQAQGQGAVFLIEKPGITPETKVRDGRTRRVFE